MSQNKRKRFSSIFVALTATALMLPLVTFTAPTAEEAINTVTIFTTNDIHGVVNGGDTVGMDTIAAIKASTPNSLLVDAGDAIQGASFATISKGVDVICMMNAAEYDLLVTGNHEFDYGTEQFLMNKDVADFPFISSNVLLDGEPMMDGTTIICSGGYSIGFVGITTTETAASINPSLLASVEFTDEINAAEENVARLAAADVDLSLSSDISEMMHIPFLVPLSSCWMGLLLRHSAMLPHL